MRLLKLGHQAAWRDLVVLSSCWWHGVCSLALRLGKQLSGGLIRAAWRPGTCGTWRHSTGGSVAVKLKVTAIGNSVVKLLGGRVQSGVVKLVGGTVQQLLCLKVTAR